MKATRMLLTVAALVALAGCDQAAPVTGPDPNGAPLFDGLGGPGSGGGTAPTGSAADSSAILLTGTGGPEGDSPARSGGGYIGSGG